jgi:hypothetical protein
MAMNQHDSVLKMYSDSGIRSVEEWAMLGRQVSSGVKPRVDAPHRGTLLPLYSRDQTQPRPPSRRKRI